MFFSSHINAFGPEAWIHLLVHILSGDRLYIPASNGTHAKPNGTLISLMLRTLYGEIISSIIGSPLLNSLSATKMIDLGAI